MSKNWVEFSLGFVTHRARMKRLLFALLIICTLISFADEPPPAGSCSTRLWRSAAPSILASPICTRMTRRSRIAHIPQWREAYAEHVGSRYKKLLRSVMPLAKARGDTSKFSDVTFTQEDGRVRISCTRYSELKGYSSRFLLLVAQRDGGDWLIVEEISESRP